MGEGRRIVRSADKEDGRGDVVYDVFHPVVVHSVVPDFGAVAAFHYVDQRALDEVVAVFGVDILASAPDLQQVATVIAGFESVDGGGVDPGSSGFLIAEWCRRKYYRSNGIRVAGCNFDGDHASGVVADDVDAGYPEPFDECFHTFCVAFDGVDRSGVGVPEAYGVDSNGPSMGSE